MIGTAKRLVECRYFRWLPGMRDLGGNFYLGQRANAPEGVHMWAGFDRGSWEWNETEFGLPDLEDPATLGCVLALVRNAWKDDGIACVTGSYTAESGYRFRIVGGKRQDTKFFMMSQKHYLSEGEALVVALELAG